MRVLEQLEGAELFLPRTIEKLLSTNGKFHGPWIYFSGLQNTDDLDFPLLISPEIEGRIKVLRIGGDVKAEPAKNLATLLTSSPATPIVIPVPKRK